MKMPKVILLSFFIVLGTSKILMPCHGMEEHGEDELDRKIGQLLMIGFQGTDPEEEEPKKICSLLHQGKLGGVILYRYNIVSPDQLLRLTQSFYEANNSVFIAVDQEGGLVQRLVPSKGFSITTPSAQDIAETYAQPEQARNLYCLMAEELGKYYINLNFAPVLDLNNPDQTSPAIGKYKRSYGNDPQLVSQFAKIVVEEHRKKRIATALKHFPGHGYSTEDTHQGIADTTQTAIPEMELAPYRNLIQSSHVDMIMTAHIVNKNYDPDGYPATLSSQVIQNLLREQLGYNGVVVSDDLHMKAIREYYKLDEVVTRALNATCDFLIFSNNTSGTYTAPHPDLPTWNTDLPMTENIIRVIHQKVIEGEIRKERIDESYKRLEKLKAILA
jgi:beta-N-acetylhexosaminidase